MSSVEGYGGVTLRYDTYGVPGDESVLLLHGGAQTRRAWKEVAERIAGRGWFAACPDLRGHGESSWAPDSDYSIAALRADVRALLEKLGSPMHLVGASLGGLVSMLVAAQSPELVKSLILVDVVAQNNPAGEDRIRDFLAAHPDGFHDLEQVANAVAAYQSHRPRPDDISGLSSYVRRMEAGMLRWHWDPAFLLHNGLPWTRRRRGPLAAAARSITVPTLLLIGELSDIIDEDALKRFISHVPHAQVKTIHGSHHMVAGDRNDEFGDAVLSWIESHEGRRA